MATWAMLAGVAAAAPSGAAAATAPLVEASVATKAGALIGPYAVRAKQVTIKVAGRRCTVGAGTPLAALIALQAKAKAPGVGRLALKDYGSCGKRPSTSSLLYLTAIGRDRADGPDGWVYDIAGRSGSTGAADPAGPFGKGRLKTGAAVAWRWCRASTDPEGDCGDALEIVSTVQRGEALSSGTAPFDVTVRVRTGAADGKAGSLTPAPAGTRVQLIDPSGRVQSDATITDATGVVRMDLDVDPPRGSRLVATANPSITPTGWAYPRPR